MNRINNLKDLLADNPKDSFVLFALAKEYEKINKFSVAEAYYQNCLEIDPENVSYLYNYALLLTALKDNHMFDTIVSKGTIHSKAQMNFEYIELFGKLEYSSNNY